MSATASAAAAASATPDQKTASDAAAYGHGLKPEEFRLFRMGEQLAHDIAYRGSKIGAEVDVYMAEMNATLKHSVHKLEVNHDGLVGYILCPKDCPKALENKIDIKIVFQGTDIKSLSSLSRDFTEEEGAGYESFHRNKHNILIQINSAIAHLKDTLATQGVDIKKLEFGITIAGHSLGAADAQRLLLAIIQTIAENLGCIELGDRYGIPFNDIHSLRLFTFNSTGVSEDNNKAADAALGWITAEKKTNSKIKLDTKIYIFYAAGDGIQQTGYTHLLHRASKELASIYFVKARNNQEGQHYITGKEVKKEIFNILKDEVFSQFTGYKNLALIGGAGVLMYAAGLGLWGSGFLSLIGNATRKAKSWYNIAKITHSTLAGAYGTFVTHTHHYFQGDFKSLYDRPLDHSFTLYTNARPEEHNLIYKEIGIKSAAANLAHKGLSVSHRLMCRRNPKKTKHHFSNSEPLPNAGGAGAASGSGSGSASASAVNTRTPQFTFQFDATDLRRRQDEAAIAKAKAEADAREAERQKMFFAATSSLFPTQCL